MDAHIYAKDFKHKMFKFCKKLTENSIPESDRFQFIDSVVFAPVKGGRRFIKVKYYTNRIETDYETGEKTLHKDTKGSIHCFVERTTGNIFKPQTWRAPYLKGNNAVRGNIYKPETFDKTDMHGGWLYHR